jgi:chloride channel protein, CIC family
VPVAVASIVAAVWRSWALVGMASMMGGTMRSPLTAMMFGIELTHDINSLLPLVIGCVSAHLATVLLLKRSILTEKVARRGHHITREYVVDPFETLSVAAIMAKPAEGLPATWTAQQTLEFFTAPEAPKRHKR